MKKPFNHKSQQTYETKQEELLDHAQKIDDLLRTPSKPGMHLTPNGAMRMNATRHAHDALSQKRVDITKELDDIAKELEKRERQNYGLKQKQTLRKSI